jgi:hypothetical protein
MMRRLEDFPDGRYSARRPLRLAPDGGTPGVHRGRLVVSGSAGDIVECVDDAAPRPTLLRRAVHIIPRRLT